VEKKEGKKKEREGQRKRGRRTQKGARYVTQDARIIHHQFHLSRELKDSQGQKKEKKKGEEKGWKTQESHTTGHTRMCDVTNVRRSPYVDVLHGHSLGKSKRRFARGRGKKKEKEKGRE